MGTQEDHAMLCLQITYSILYCVRLTIPYNIGIVHVMSIPSMMISCKKKRKGKRCNIFSFNNDRNHPSVRHFLVVDVSFLSSLSKGTRLEQCTLGATDLVQSIVTC